MLQFRTLEDGGNTWHFFFTSCESQWSYPNFAEQFNVLFHPIASNWGQNIRLSEWVQLSANAMFWDTPIQTGRVRSSCFLRV